MDWVYHTLLLELPALFHLYPLVFLKLSHPDFVEKKRYS
jgi:hypothetical protein